jgi:hypothetical protein
MFIIRPPANLPLASATILVESASPGPRSVAKVSLRSVRKPAREM